MGKVRGSGSTVAIVVSNSSFNAVLCHFMPSASVPYLKLGI